ncbi:unnamed protein product [Prunus armeniaca]
MKEMSLLEILANMERSLCTTLKYHKNRLNTILLQGSQTGSMVQMVGKRPTPPFLYYDNHTIPTIHTLGTWLKWPHVAAPPHLLDEATDHTLMQPFTSLLSEVIKCTPAQPINLGHVTSTRVSEIQNLAPLLILQRPFSTTDLGGYTADPLRLGLKRRDKKGLAHSKGKEIRQLPIQGWLLELRSWGGLLLMAHTIMVSRAH